VNFWNQGLHQGASVLRMEAVTGADSSEKVSNVFFFPLMVSLAGFVLLFVALVFYRTGTEIRARRIRALQARERIGT
ncbi:MAG: transcriptional regulator, partial [Pseudomonadota bacterium]